MRYWAIFLKYCTIMRYCAISSSFEICDWNNSCVTQLWACDTKCDTIEDYFHGQTLIKFIFKSKLWHNVSFVPHFNPNLPKFWEISKFGALFGYSKKFLVLRIRYDVPSLRFTDHKQLQNDFCLSWRHNTLNPQKCL